MDYQYILEHVKYNLGISTNVRDAFLLGLIEDAEADLNNLGINIDGQDESYVKSYRRHLIVYVAWLYESGSQEEKPAHIREGENNLQIGYEELE